MSAAEARLEGAALFAHPISAALFEAIREHGFGSLEVGPLLTRAGIGTDEFRAGFAGKADLTLKVFEATIADYEDRVGRAFEAERGWPGSIRAAAYETVRWIGNHPDAAWFGMVGALDAGDMVLARRARTFLWAASLIDAGRSVAADPDAVPAAAPLIAVGAVAETLRRQQEGSLEESILGAVPQMMCAAVRPYLGEEAAQRELSIPPPADLRGEGS
jgi:hypothetical protein